ncbi:Protein YLS3 [Ananas comosus]|uniref:Protein YLS3 n=1 Tax=Ananas comosus TaxID=4615 RepID=A0A199USX6_ANACO|nr:Protein YLS3 [Ananas comosus]
MEFIKHNVREIMLLLAVILVFGAAPISGQVASSCTSSLISSFTPCFNFLTGSTNGGGGGSPTADCCKSLAGVITGSTSCVCLILTGNVPFGLPINRTLAISLPRICSSMSVPLQCNDVATPLPGPGSSIAFGPALPPLAPMPPQSSIPPLTTFSPPEATSPSPSSSVEPVAQSPTTGDRGVNQGQRPLVLSSSATKHSQYYLGFTALFMFVFRVVVF